MPLRGTHAGDAGGGVSPRATAWAAGRSREVCVKFTVVFVVPSHVGGDGGGGGTSVASPAQPDRRSGEAEFLHGRIFFG